jgi:hypothetical protein
MRRALAVGLALLAWAAGAPADEAGRLQQWERWRIRACEAHGRVSTNAGTFTAKDLPRLFHAAGAVDALAQWQQARQSRRQGWVWMGSLVVVGALAGAGAGAWDEAGQAHTVQYPSLMSHDPESATVFTWSPAGSTEDGRGLYMAMGAVLGAVIGWDLGALGSLPLLARAQAQAQGQRMEALRSYNRALLRNLRLEAAPTARGFQVGIQGHF